MGWRDFCTDWWLDKADRLETEWAGGVPVNWYACRTVWDCGLFSMDYGHAATQLAMLPPEYLGAAGSSPTPTDLNHLFHLLTADALDQRGIVEWGGGFGNSARFGSWLTGAAYTIVDIPIMSALQRTYLASVRSMGVVNLCGHDGVTTKPDLFLAAFSLDECTTAAHDFLFDHDWYGARHVVIVAQTHGKEDMFPDAASLAERLRAAGFSETPALQVNASYFRLSR